MFQHHNYEVSSQRRGSKVIRRYSDFVWLLDCLQKRYPFRILPLLPPKRMAVNGNHLSNDGAFIEKRRRGLARYLNALVRHPILSQEQLVVMFMTVPTVSLHFYETITTVTETHARCRNWPSGGNSRPSPCKTSSPAEPCSPGSRTLCRRHSKSSSPARGQACVGRPSFTSTSAISWIGSSSGARASPQTMRVSPCRSPP